MLVFQQQPKKRNRRPDVQTVGAHGKVKSVVEVGRRLNSQRNKDREKEYGKLGVPHETVPSAVCTAIFGSASMIRT